ncbi:FAD-dependent monooxygenase [Actinocrispum sp. NPDC049592]|uniref:FAD-dependent monooxygenase n=1 Tax=Actinocrispum sp. NPDC049592 TaxID=3154835 RepID=UPI00343A3C01
MAQVIVVGAGPTGLALASELALNGIDCKVLEKRPPSQSSITRAFGVNARTLELLDARGLADTLVPLGTKIPAAAPNVGVTLSFAGIDSRFQYMLIVPQNGTEAVLRRRCEDLGVQIVREAEVVGLDQDEHEVQLHLKNGSVETASYVVACDGAHSKVREILGTQFVGEQYEVQLLLADVKMDHPPTEFMFGKSNENGIQIFIPFGDGYHRSIAWRHNVNTSDAPVTVDEVRETIKEITRADFGLSDMRWGTRFVSERRQAAHYREGRVFLAGDAAHVHSPVGAQGMNTGISDAMNLGWKLAAAVKGTAPSWLLDTYETERHPVGEAVLKNTDRLFKISALKSGPARKMAQILMKTAFKFEIFRRMPREFLTGLGFSYSPRGDNKIDGKRASDVHVDGVRLAEAARDGRFVLVDTTNDQNAAAIARAECGDRVTVLSGRFDDEYRTAAPVMLVRPDGYVAWASEDGADAGAALAGWWGSNLVSVS